MDEIVKIIRIESDGAEQTVAGLVSEIKNLTEAMNGVAKGTEEYTNILKQLSENQEKLGKAMKANKQEVSAAEGSYNALVKQMASLKKQWRETTDEASRKELGNQIKDINGKLKNMDASIGNFQRNVGNYADGVKSAFGSMSGAAKGMVGPLNSVKQAFTALSAHPLMAVLTALSALLINGIAKGFKSSEENTNKLREAFSGFQAIGDAITNMFQKLAGWIGNVANAAINLADKLGLLSPKFKERQEMMKKQIALEKQERDAILDKAKLETESAELRAKASDEENYSISQRIEFLQQAQAKEEEQLQMEKQILEQKVAQLEAQLALTDSTGEELTKLNELKAQVIQVNAKIAQSQRSTNKEITALRRRGLSEQQQANQARLNLEKDLLKQEYDLAAKGSDERLRLAKELRKKELDIQLEGLKQKFKNRSDYEKAEKLALTAYNKDIQQIEVNHSQEQKENQQVLWDIRLMGLKEGSSTYFAEYFKILNEKYDEIDKKGQALISRVIEKANELLAEGGMTQAEAIDKAGGLISDETGKTFNQYKLELLGYNRELEKTYKDHNNALENEINEANQLILYSTRPMSKYYETQGVQLKEQLKRLDESYKDLKSKNLLTIQEENVIGNKRNALLKQIDDVRAQQAEAFLNERKRYWAMEREIETKGAADVFGDLEFEVKQAKDEYSMAADDLFNSMIEKVDIIAKETGKLPSVVIERLRQGFELAKNGEDPFGIESFSEIFKKVYELGIIPDETIDRFLKGPRTIKEKTLAYNEEIKQSYMQLASYIAQSFSAIGDIYNTNLNNRKKMLEKEGKYDDQERENLKKQYKWVQAMKISEAVINTLSGIVAALTAPSYQSMGAIGMALAAAQATAVGLAGAAQVYQIASTNPFDDNTSKLSGGGSDIMSATVQAPVSDFEPQYSQNLTGRSDIDYLNDAFSKTPIWVSVVDVNNAQERGRVIVKESSF